MKKKKKKKQKKTPLFNLTLHFQYSQDQNTGQCINQTTYLEMRNGLPLCVMLLVHLNL